MMRRPVAIALALVLMAAAAPAAVTEPRETLLVAWEPAVPHAARDAIHESLGGVVTGTIPDIGVDRVDVPSGALASYAAQPYVRFAEPVPDVGLFEAPSDPLLSQQWPIPTLGVRRAWRSETGARSPVLVAVVDTGVDVTHPDLEGRVVTGYDFLQLDEQPQDNHGHGTHIAGVIAANSDNRVGIAGMSWGAKILPVRVCNRKGGCDGFAVIEGIVYAIARGARIVNLSLGGAGTECPQTFALVAELAARRDVLLVASSGNSAQSGNPVNYPAACDGYMGVGATTLLDTIADFSSFGPYVDVTAPGQGIMSTLPLGRTRKSLTPGYGMWSGTSMAAPHVAGLAALLLSQDPGRSAAELEQRMIATAVDLGPRGRDDRYGAGRIDVEAAVR